MRVLEKNGIKPLDALHIACAIEAKCDYFITVDKGILKKKHLSHEIKIVNPIDFLDDYEDK